MENHESPLFSVVIPTHNRAKFLSKAVKSVLQQSYRKFELIIVDDGSMDNTRELIEKLEDDRIRYVFQDNLGAASARNRGIEQAQGQWIAFLDSDDWWDRNKLVKTVRAIEENKDIKIFHTEELWYRSGKIHNPRKKYKKPDGYAYLEAIQICCLSISTVVIHKEVFDRVGMFDEEFEACEDYDFWLRATHKYHVKLIPEFLTKKDGGRPDQLSFTVWGLDRFRINALTKMLETANLSQGEYLATYQAMKKKCEIFAKGAQKRGREVDAQFYISLINMYAPDLPKTTPSIIDSNGPALS